MTQNIVANVQKAANSFVGGQASPPKEDVRVDEVRKQVKEIRAIAKKLEGQVQKYPRSGRGLLKKMQDRYIACIPLDNALESTDEKRELGNSNQSPAAQELSRWKGGNLAYWEHSSDFKTGIAPKGVVPLLRIAKVAVSKDDSQGRSVLVKHKMSSEMCELVLCFPSKRDAEEWSYMLWDLISKLRGHQTMGGLTSSIALYD